MQTAYVLLLCKQGFENNIFSTLKKEKVIKEIIQTFGPYDAIVKLEENDNDSLRDIVYNKIRRIPNIESTITLTVSS